MENDFQYIKELYFYCRAPLLVSYASLIAIGYAISSNRIFLFNYHSVHILPCYRSHITCLTHNQKQLSCQQGFHMFNALMCKLLAVNTPFEQVLAMNSPFPFSLQATQYLNYIIAKFYIIGQFEIKAI